MPIIDSFTTITPAELGLPPRFKVFRDAQKEALDFTLVGPTGDPADLRRFTAMGLPAGIGKSALSHAIGRASGLRYVVLTATRALEQQQVDDKFICVNVRGRANYECVDRDPLHPERRWSCEDGRDEEGCRLADTKLCTYGARVEQARTANDLSNYAYWSAARSRNRGALEKASGRPVELLICDEAHLIANNLSRALSTWMSNTDLHRFAGDEVRAAVREGKGAEWGRVGPKWIAALTRVWAGVAGRMADIEGGYDSETTARRSSKEYRRLERLSDSLDRVVTLADAGEGSGKGNGNWIWIDGVNRGVKFECVWPARYAERYLWSGVPKVVLMSATLRPKALSLCGVPASNVWFREWPRVFPAANCPVYHLTTGTRMRHGATEEETGRVVAALDAIYDGRTDRKCIVHTGSYKRAEWLQSQSKYGRCMILNKPGAGEAVRAADKFRESRAPSMLVGPSFVTGWDFPSTECELIVFIKLPFGDRSDPIVQAQNETDGGETYTYDAMQSLVQGCYRGQRHEEDKAEVFILDDSVARFMNYGKVHAPRWFRVRTVSGIPAAPEKMQIGT